MIAYNLETPLYDLQAARLVIAEFTGKKPPCYETVRQWAKQGRSGVVLETKFIGRDKYTSRKAIERFIDNYTAVRSPESFPMVDYADAEAARQRILATISPAQPANQFTTKTECQSEMSSARMY